ncbi:hypothetical protein B0H10DRAFT_2194414 [Mycena sp. CBHHK59/15]|nr:hypothetical protein B0H10DRAFT_2194414 [Mycena sp. CBHHK59/15]
MHLAPGPRAATPAAHVATPAASRATIPARRAAALTYLHVEGHLVHLTAHRALKDTTQSKMMTAAFLALQASNEFQAQRKRKRDGSEKTVSTQAMGRGIRMLAALFGEIPMIVTDAEAYALDRYGDDDFDDFPRTSRTKSLPTLRTNESEDRLCPFWEFTDPLYARRCERNLGAYQQIMRLVPALKHKLVGTGPAGAASLSFTTRSCSDWAGNFPNRPGVEGESASLKRVPSREVEKWMNERVSVAYGNVVK